MGDGEQLIKNVYDAIRKNDALWQSSMLVIVYDEHGGIFDHASPIPMPSPDGKSSVEPAFDFTLSGVRVPAVVVSPYIKPRTISSQAYDHTSLIATAMTLFVGPDQWPSAALGTRAQHAADLTGLLDLDMDPRMEMLEFGAAPEAAVLRSVHGMTETAKLSDLQKEHLIQASSVNANLPAELQLRQRAEQIQDPVMAHAYVKHVAKAAIAARGDQK